MGWKSWVPATALALSSVMAMTGSVPRDAMAGIVTLTRFAGDPTGLGEGPAKFRSAADAESGPQREVSARYWGRAIVLLIIILLVLWLIYRTFAGWKFLIGP